MFHHRTIASSILAVCIAGCAPDDDHSRIVTDLPRDGYALFEVKPGGAKRVAFVVELRDVEEGTFVLLYTPSEPTSAGWFELDASSYFPCRHFGPDSTEDVELGCIVPDGRGALVDAVVADHSKQSILRHQLGDGVEPNTHAPGGWYAVMRVAKTGPTIPIAVEAIAMDDVEPFESPAVKVRR